MELIIHTKYAIGQEVYLKKTALDFSRGYFIDVEVPDTTLIELPLQESIREDKIFSSLEEVEAHCKHDS